MPDLPIYPQKREAPGYALERRLGRLQESPQESYEHALVTLRQQCAIETLKLTGAPNENESSELVAAQLDALALIERNAAGATDEPTVTLIREVHRRANPGSDGSFRETEVPPQFKAARSSPPRHVGAKLDNLLQWLAAESGREMFPAARMALWLARFVEIAPFEHGNFRTGHLLTNFFAAGAGFPAVSLRLEDADAIRGEIERAMQFDTAPLVERFNRALESSLRTCEEAAAREAE
jgi:Fic family protein